MAKTKNPDGLSTIEISMGELVVLFTRCDAVFSEGLFGWTADRQIDKIGKNAKQAIDYKIGEELATNRERRKKIEEKHREPYKDVAYDEANDVIYRDALRKDKEYTDLIAREGELWEIKIPDFAFTPVKVKITNEVTKNLKKTERQIFYKEKTYPVEVYAALGYLVDNGYLVETK